MVKRNDKVTFLHAGVVKDGRVCSVVNGKCIIETGWAPVLGFFVTVPAWDVWQKEAA